MVSRLHMTKHHGLGNDFLVVLDERQDRGTAGIGPAEALRWCDRHRGIGADGLIVGHVPDADTGVDVVMELFNADGSVAEISGNGIRCLCQAHLEHRGEPSGSVVIEAAGGRRELTARVGSEPRCLMVRVDMGPVSDIGPIDASAVVPDAVHVGSASVGNPHLVIDLGDPALVRDADVIAIGSQIDRRTPGGINVHLVAATGASALEIRHFERGAGATQACGSGATVAATLMSRWGLVEPRVEVSMPGGTAVVDVASSTTSSAFLEGPTVHIAEITVERDPAEFAANGGRRATGSRRG